MRFQKVGALLHRTRGQQHLRHKDLILFEPLADDPHARAQSLVEEIRRGHALLQGRCHEAHHLGCPPLDHCFLNLLDTHAHLSSFNLAYPFNRIQEASFTLRASEDWISSGVLGFAARSNVSIRISNAR
ncbi:MAG: hypothetical protein BWX70_02651 [Verrucomicrobia bacterium ADurb.Bin070]|nr:MAG: hypothetical protein BWX70_02651 [Verrucomicrobia bacterium ADurb.Bin070]